MHLKVALVVVSLSSVSVACSEKESTGDKGTASSAKASCVVEIQKKAGEGDKVKVNGTGADEAAAEADAWAKAAAAAPDEKDLKDETKWKRSLTPVTAKLNGEVTQNANLTLTRVVPVIKAEAGGPDADTACLAATQKACETAGAGPDCVSSGAYDEMSVMGQSN